MASKQRYNTGEALKLLSQHFNETPKNRTEAARELFAAMRAAFDGENTLKPHVLIKQANSAPGFEGGLDDGVSMAVGQESRGPKAPTDATIVYSSQSGFWLCRQRADPKKIELHFDAAQLKWDGRDGRDGMSEIFAAWLE
jgi:hypothetical protein